MRVKKKSAQQGAKKNHPLFLNFQKKKITQTNFQKKKIIQTNFQEKKITLAKVTKKSTPLSD